MTNLEPSLGHPELKEPLAIDQPSDQETVAFWHEWREGLDASRFFDHAASMLARDVIGDEAIKFSTDRTVQPDHNAIKQQPFYASLDANDRVRLLTSLGWHYHEYFGTGEQADQQRMLLQLAVTNIATIYQLDRTARNYQRCGIPIDDIVTRAMIEKEDLTTFIENSVDNNVFNINRAIKKLGVFPFLSNWFELSCLADNPDKARRWSHACASGMLAESAFKRTLGNYFGGYELTKSSIMEDLTLATDFVATNPVTDKNIYIQIKGNYGADKLSIEPQSKKGRSIVRVTVPTRFVTDELTLPPHLAKSLGDNVIDFAYPLPQTLNSQQ